MNRILSCMALLATTLTVTVPAVAEECLDTRRKKIFDCQANQTCERSDKICASASDVVIGLKCPGGYNPSNISANNDRSITRFERTKIIRNSERTVYRYEHVGNANLPTSSSANSRVRVTYSCLPHVAGVNK